MMLLQGCLMVPLDSPFAADSFAVVRERNSLDLCAAATVVGVRKFVSL